VGARVLSQTWPAPAKINVFLRVTGRLPDGYHLLQTVFQFLDYGDRLRIRARDDGRIVRHGGPPGVAPDDDLVVRAAVRLRAETGAQGGADIRLEKRLPVGGGLGGGSSDAATTLLVLDRLWGLHLGEDALAGIGLELGADVPVFVRGRAAWAEGVGERLTPVDLPEPWYVVVVPPVQVSTAAVFAQRGLTPFSPLITIRDFHAGEPGNDLEPVVRRLYPEVDFALRWLSDHGNPRMSGTGACVYAPVADARSGRAILARLPAPYRGFVARGCNRSPLHDALAGSPGNDADGV